VCVINPTSPGILMGAILCHLKYSPKLLCGIDFGGNSAFVRVIFFFPEEKENYSTNLQEGR
jgi:hypothetical protein